MKKILPLLFFAAIFAQALFSEDSRQLLSSINDIRGIYHLIPLQSDPILTAAAEAYAEECVRQGYISHKDRKGDFAVQRVRKMGGTAVKVAEILGAGQNVDSVISDWMGSPAHGAIILNNEWSHAGGSVAQTEKGFVVIMLFQMRPFSRIDVEVVSSGLQVSITREGYDRFTPILFSRGEIILPLENVMETDSRAGSTALFQLREDQIFYHILAGLMDGNDIIFTDRILVP